MITLNPQITTRHMIKAARRALAFRDFRILTMADGIKHVPSLRSTGLETHARPPELTYCLRYIFSSCD